MRPATKKDTKNAVEIISKSFQTNPSILWVIKQDHKQRSRTRALALYSFRIALLRRGAYLSDNGKGIALCYRSSSKRSLLAEYWNQVILVFRAIGIERVGIVLRRQAYIESIMPKNIEYLYFWFFGVEPGYNGRGGASEIKNALFEMSARENLPIYLETSVEKNRRVYERYGFEVYHSWKVENPDITLYFMRREPMN